MRDRPTAAELLDTIADLLEGEVLGALSGPLQHQVRVAGNLCRILGREQKLGAAADARERERLRALLGADDAADLAELNARLARRLLEGEDEDFERRAWQVLVDVTRDELAIDKPGYDAWDASGERRPPADASE